MTDRKIPILYPAEDIAKRVQELAREIAQITPPDVMIVALLRGSFVFTADLVRALHLAGMRPQMDFMTLASYGLGTSGGALTVQRDISEDVKDRDVLVVDDILESGRTLDFACTELKRRGAKNIRIAVLLEKPGKCSLPIKADFVGFRVPDKFVVGYGLDYAGYYRELPYIGTVEVH